MSIRFESNFDAGKFEANLKKQMNAGLKRYAAKLQGALDGVHERMSGRPVEEVKTELQSTWRATTGDGDITDPHLTEFAQAISDGQRVVLDTTQFHV